MTTFKTGRTRTLTFGGTITGSRVENDEVASLPGHPPPNDYASNCQLQAFGQSWQWETYFGFDSMHNILQTLTVEVFGVTNTFTNTTTLGFPTVGSPVHADCTISGSWSVTIPVEEVIVTNFPGYDPTIVGTQKVDPPQPFDPVFGERMVIGGSITLTVNAGGCSGSNTQTITSGNQSTFFSYSNVYNTYIVTATAWCYSFAGEAAFASIQTQMNSSTFGVPGYSGSDANHSWDGTGGVSVTASSTFPSSAFSIQLLTVAMYPQTCDMSFKIDAMGEAYPDAISIIDYLYLGSTGNVVALSGGVGTDSFSQAYLEAGYLENNTWQGISVPILYTLNTLSAVSAKIQTASMTTLQEDTDLTRLLGRGYMWSSMTVNQAVSVNADAGAQSSRWTGGVHTTVANSGGSAITATIAGGVGSISSSLSAADSSLKNTNWSGVSFQGYRYLRLYLTADAASQPATVVIGSKTWVLSVGLTGFIDIDLCNPSNNPAQTDGWDSTWSWSAPPYAVSDGPLSGVTNVGTITIQGLADTHVYTLGQVEIIRKDHATLSFLPTYKGWIQAFPAVSAGPVTTTTYYRRAIQGDTDGRQSREGTDAVWEHITSSGSPVDTYGEVAISSLVAGFASGGVPPRDGFTATDLQPNPGGCTGGGFDGLTCLLNSDASVCWLAGGGLYFDGTNWHSGIGFDVTGTATIPAQMLWDTCCFYPQCGDVWQVSGSAYGGDFKAYMGAVLRGNSWGLCLNNTGPDVGDTVTATETDNSAVVGTATSNSIGQYFHSAVMGTNLPYGKGLKAIATSTTIGTHALSFTRNYLSRRRHRVCFDYPVTITPTTSSDVSLLSYRVGYYMAYVNGTGQLQLNRMWHADMTFDFTATIDTAMDCEEPHLCVQSWTGLVSCVYIRGAGTMASPFYMCRQISTDWAATWTNEATFAGGSNGVRHVAEIYNEISGERVLVYNDMSIMSGGSPTGQGYMWAKIFDRYDTEVMSSPFQVDTGSISDDASFGLTYVDGSPLAIDLVYPVSGTHKRYRSTDNGRTWSAL